MTEAKWRKPEECEGAAYYVPYSGHSLGISVTHTLVYYNSHTGLVTLKLGENIEEHDVASLGPDFRLFGPIPALPPKG